jgi:hypothetical protein
MGMLAVPVMPTLTGPSPNTGHIRFPSLERSFWKALQNKDFSKRPELK